MMLALSALAHLSTAQQLRKVMQVLLVMLLLVQVGLQRQQQATAGAALLGSLVPGHRHLQRQGGQLAVMLC
jgi:hypothetical protein